MALSPVVALEIVRLTEGRVPELLDLLREVEKESSGFFRPHPFNRGYLESLCDGSSRDLYYLLQADRDAVGYGILRGWDEGFEIPSLGICVHPSHRHAGLASMLIRFLHCAARARGARRVRLRVHAENRVAIGLYRNMGYEFDDVPENVAAGRLLTAFKTLAP